MSRLLAISTALLLGACLSAPQPQPAPLTTSPSPTTAAPPAEPGATASAPAPSADSKPADKLAAPAGNALVLTVSAKGSQIYTCAPGKDGGAPAWTFTAPEAELFDGSGAKVGTHGAGPFWQVADGSKVIGAVREKADSPDGSIPWLLLEAKSHEGSGRLAAVTFIQRTDTRGGKAPAAGCDAGHAGEKQSVPYTASYLFYSAK